MRRESDKYPKRKSLDLYVGKKGFRLELRGGVETRPNRGDYAVEECERPSSLCSEFSTWTCRSSRVSFNVRKIVHPPGTVTL